MLPPRDKRELRRLLGATCWLSKYTKKFATKTAALFDLLKKKHKSFKWEEVHDKALQELKTYFTTAPVLKLPSLNPNDKYMLFVDGSEVALGSVLLQRQNGKLFVIGYASKPLSDVFPEL